MRREYFKMSFNQVKRALGIALALMLIFSFCGPQLSASAIAPGATFIIDLSYPASGTGVTYAGAPETLTFDTDANGNDYTIIQSVTTPQAVIDIIFETGVAPGSVTLNGIDIIGNVELKGTADVTLLLSSSGENDNIINGSILVPDDGTDVAALTIDSASAAGSSDGSLSVINTNPDNAAIGGADAQSAGVITINGGAVTAIGYKIDNPGGSSYGAGIGGGNGGDGGTITINGGIVNAIGNNSYGGNSDDGLELHSYGAGIGGGNGGNGGTITITGGTVDARGGTTSSIRVSDTIYRDNFIHGAGIGGGNGGAGGTITITGGEVTAYGLSRSGFAYGAGIGGGDGGNSGNIMIDGGDITAYGFFGSLGYFIGSVYVSSGAGYGAGIGGGRDGEGAAITINDGQVVAFSNGQSTNAGCFGSAIGGGGSDSGDGCSGGTISINGGRVNAMGNYGAGIGGGGSDNGNGGDGGTITISGSAHVSARGGISGSGIGGGGSTTGNGGSGGIITLGGSIEIRVVNVYGSGAGIGGGGSDSGVGGAGGTITIIENASLLVWSGTIANTGLSAAGIGGGTGSSGNGSGAFIHIDKTVDVVAQSTGYGLPAIHAINDNAGDAYYVNIIVEFDNPPTTMIDLDIYQDGSKTAPIKHIISMPGYHATGFTIPQRGSATAGYDSSGSVNYNIHVYNRYGELSVKAVRMIDDDEGIFSINRLNGYDAYNTSIGEGWLPVKTVEYSDYAVTVVNSSAAVTGAGTYTPGAVVNIDAGSQRGFSFTGWVTNDGLTFDSESSAATTFIMPEKNVMVTAHWQFVGGRDEGGGGGGGGPVITVSPPPEEVVIEEEETPLGPFISDHVAYIIGYPEGDVWPQRNITRAEVATVFFRLLTDDMRTENWTQENPYPDVQAGKWFNNAVSVMSNMGILQGYPDGTFKPDAPITRAEMATIAARFALEMQMEQLDEKSFSDVSGHWAKEDILFAAAIGWVNGYPDGTYMPNQPITRAEFMTLVNRMLERVPETADDLLSDEMITWVDNADPTAWYYLAVQEATNSHIPEYKEDSDAPGLPTGYERWLELTENRDWAELETSWSMAN